ncbi:hypothetical protein AB5I41_22855 [Sphingomonas sp. MMS24-JH45]
MAATGLAGSEAAALTILGDSAVGALGIIPGRLAAEQRITAESVAADFAWNVTGGAAAGALAPIARGVIGRIGALTTRAAEAIGSRGLRGSSVVSAERADVFLVKNGFTSARAQEFIGSFDGPITARIVRPGEDFLRYTDYAGSSGSF